MMPTNIAELVWITGGGTMLILLAVVGFFLVRLVDGLDLFKREVTGTLTELRGTLSLMREVMGNRVNDLNTRLTVIEEAGCVVHRKRSAHRKESEDGQS